MAPAAPSDGRALTIGPIRGVVERAVGDFTNGRALAERLVVARPSMRLVVMSGYGSDLTVGPENAPAFLAKPFTRDELLTIVAKTLVGPLAESVTPQPELRRRSRW